MEIQVKGHSGCQIEVVPEGEHLYVYKSSQDAKYLNRLELQGNKQNNAYNNIDISHVRIPKVYEIKKDKNKTYLKMDYIYSKNFVEFFEQAGVEQINYVIQSIKDFIEYELDDCKLEESSQVFKDKFNSVYLNVEKNPLFENNEKVKFIMKESNEIFDNLENFVIPIGLCHGDLTFSNILFNANNYYLIDFLDSFVETPLQDIVKIRQDTKYHWSELMYTKRYDEVHLGIIFDKIDSEIDNYFSRKYMWYNDNYKVVQLMNILRILPYAHEEKVIERLIDVLLEILDKYFNKKF